MGTRDNQPKIGPGAPCHGCGRPIPDDVQIAAVYCGACGEVEPEPAHDLALDIAAAQVDLAQLQQLLGGSPKHPWVREVGHRLIELGLRLTDERRR